LDSNGLPQDFWYWALQLSQPMADFKGRDAIPI
jgi:hypothetical protein